MADRPYDPADDEYVIGGPYPQTPDPEPDAEPVIGGGYPPVRYAEPPPPEPRIGDYPQPGYPPAPGYTPAPVRYQPEPAYDAGYDDQYEDEYYEDDDGYYYDDEPVARQPLFWVVLGLGVMLVVGFVFVLFALFAGGNGGGGDTAFNVAIDSPQDNARVEIGREFEVVVQASSNEAIIRFELFVDGTKVDEFNTASPVPGTVQRAIMHHTFEERGDYRLHVRVTAESGATRDSNAITVVAREAVDETPAAVSGRVIAVVSARTGPGEEFDVVGSLQPDDEVIIRGKTRNNEWLLVDSPVGDGVWVRRAAIEADDALALVPVREPTPTPQATATESPSETPTGTATPDASLPDFLPVGAVLVDGGDTVRITVQNSGGSAYAGPMVVSISQLESVTQVFTVNIPVGGSATVDIPLTTTVTEQRTVRVTVDPDNAIAESLEDNNAATFTVNPPVEAPSLVIDSVTVQSPTVTVVVRNNGGALQTSDVSVRVQITIEGQTESSPTVTQTIALAPNQTANFAVNISGLSSGSGTVVLLLNGSIVASTPVGIP